MSDSDRFFAPNESPTEYKGEAGKGFDSDETFKLASLVWIISHKDRVLLRVSIGWCLIISVERCASCWKLESTIPLL